MTTRSRWNVVRRSRSSWCAGGLRLPAGVGAAGRRAECADRRGGCAKERRVRDVPHTGQPDDARVEGADRMRRLPRRRRRRHARRDGGAPVGSVRGREGARARARRGSTIWTSSANPVRPAAATLQESLAFVRFVNPGDLRVVSETCVPCHTKEVNLVRRSMMAHGAMLWGAALYNNGSVPFKGPRFGEFYTSGGEPGTAVRRSVCCQPRASKSSRACCRCSSRSSGGSCRRRATCCGSSSAAGARRSVSASRIPTKSRDVRPDGSAIAASARSIVPIRCSSACRKRG